MIDINELRQSAQSATPGPWYIGSGTHEGRNIYSVEAVTDDEGFTYNPVVATAEDDGNVCWEANAHLIAAANPAAISELLDRLEAAENELVEIRHGAAVANDTIKALRTKLEHVEKQRDALIGTMRVLAARPAADEGRNNWEAIVWESICFAEEAIARTTGDQP